MTIAPFSDNEPEQAEALNPYGLLYTEPEAPLADLAELAGSNFVRYQSRRSAWSLPFHQWSRGTGAVPLCIMPCACAFCAHTILPYEVFEVPNTLADSGLRRIH